MTEETKLPEPRQKWRGTSKKHTHTVTILKTTARKVHYSIYNGPGTQRKNEMILDTEMFVRRYKPLGG